jgi:hypothetical protein
LRRLSFSFFLCEVIISIFLFFYYSFSLSFFFSSFCFRSNAEAPAKTHRHRWGQSSVVVSSLTTACLASSPEGISVFFFGSKGEGLKEY